jgi:hypothetical protein
MSNSSMPRLLSTPIERAGALGKHTMIAGVD